MASAFERLPGSTQGRIAPLFEAPPLDSFVFCLGSDRPGDIQPLVVGSDSIVLSQIADVTGIALIRFRAIIRPPSSMPAFGLTRDTVISPTGLGTTPEPLVAITPKWRFLWGYAAATSGFRTLVPGKRLVLNDGAIDVSAVTGIQTIKFTLALSA